MGSKDKCGESMDKCETSMTKREQNAKVYATPGALFFLQRREHFTGKHHGDCPLRRLEKAEKASSLAHTLDALSSVISRFVQLLGNFNPS